MNLRILAVDDHPIVRLGIRALIEVEPDFTLVGEAVDAASALHLFDRLRPDVTLLDLQMPDMHGLDVLRHMRALWPPARIMILTTYRGDANAREALAAGAAGYLLKNALGSELANGIRAVAMGRKCISPEVAIDVASHSGDEGLTQRELAILRAAAAGNENKVIASRLGISVETVKSHMRHVLGKLSARNRTDALRIALDRGLLAPGRGVD